MQNVPRNMSQNSPKKAISSEKLKYSFFSGEGLSQHTQPLASLLDLHLRF